jgi:cytochrome c553
MKRALGLWMVIACAPLAHGADIEAGKTKAAIVCAACHGANGVSVSESIPNLAAQRAGYLAAQLRALKDGTRRNPLMNAIASQLSAEDISNVAAYFAAQPGPQAGTKSDFLPNLATTRVTFPEGYRESFARYHTINFPATKQVRHYFANKVAAQAAKEGKALPDGSVLFAEVHSAKLDAEGKPLSGADGFFVADKLLFYTAMARAAGWGADIPEMLRNENWNYAAFSTDRQPRSINQAECLACHKPLDRSSYAFTLKELANAR